MIPKRIAGATRYLGAPAGWDPEKNVECSHLAIVDSHLAGGQPIMLSAWEPTPAEIEAIKEGAPVFLQICGMSHPPVAVFVDVEKPPRKMSVGDRDILDKWAGRIEVLLDGTEIDDVVEYDCDAGFLVRQRRGPDGQRLLNADRSAVETETLRGKVEVRRR